MVFKNLCVFVIWTKVDLALERLRFSQKYPWKGMTMLGATGMNGVNK